MSQRESIHNNIYFVSLILLACSLALSEFTMSLFQFIIAINWFAEGNFRRKIEVIKKNPEILIFSGMLLVHALWMINSENIEYGIDDIRTKLPLLTLPILIGTSKALSQKQIKILLQIFILSILAGTMASMLAYTGILQKEIYDIRDISIFISHIRFALLINLAIFFCIYYGWIAKIQASRLEKLLYFVLAIWFVAFLFLLQSLTGLFIMASVGYLLILWTSLQQKNRVIKFTGVFVLLGILAGTLAFLSISYNKFYSLNEINLQTAEKFTALGNEYNHDLNNPQIENGNYVGYFICEKELREKWNTLSKFSYDSLDKKGQEIKYTLIRYLTSKGLKKDAEGLSQITAEDIGLIESGVANYRYTESFNPYMIVYKLIWQIHMYRASGNPSGHSVTQRLEYLKMARHIISENFWTGVGTGDVKDSFKSSYETLGSVLPEKMQRRTHNQLITFLLSFGLPGFILISFCMIYPIVKRRRDIGYLFAVFIIIAMLSMVNEDTLESQPGVTFFSFFYSLFIFNRSKSVSESQNDEYEA